jgi:hypothetical protein
MISMDDDISTTDQMSCTCNLLEEKLQCSAAAHKPFTHSMATYYSNTDKVLYDIPRLIYP